MITTNTKTKIVQLIDLYTEILIEQIHTNQYRYLPFIVESLAYDPVTCRLCHTEVNGSTNHVFRDSTYIATLSITTCSDCYFQLADPLNKARLRLDTAANEHIIRTLTKAKYIESCYKCKGRGVWVTLHRQEIPICVNCVVQIMWSHKCRWVYMVIAGCSITDITQTILRLMYNNVFG